MAHRLHQVDVFAEAPLEGNALAVVLDAGDLDDATLQAIARETNLSETTFVLGEQAGAWRVRIFTPTAELPFAGHPTLGTAWVIRHHRLDSAPERVRLALGVGEVPVDFEKDEHDGTEIAWLTAPAIRSGATLPGAELAGALGLEPADLEASVPVQHFDAGVQILVVPLASPGALARARLDLACFEPLAARGFAPYVYLVARSQAADRELEARFFFDAGGVREDPATGSATACLGAWLLEHRWLGSGPLELRIAQGAAIGRPSRLRLRARRGAAGDAIQVGGHVVPVLEARLL